MSIGGYAADWPAPPGVSTWQTTRTGGVSTGAYASLNLAQHVGDRNEDVARNRARLARTLSLPSEPLWLEQVHGTTILRIDPADGAVRPVPGCADGAVTAAAGVVLTVMTADCLPVLLAARDGSEIGVAHAGWRGLAAGVLECAIAAFATRPAGLMAWLGPAIAPAAFEVGAEVRARFLEGDPACAEAFAANARGRWQADLYRLARRRLQAAGLTAIHGATACTHADAARFFSHRRAAPCGRMASLIWRESER